MNKFADMIIPDSQLAEYLRDKLLIKPDCDASLGPTEIPSDYESVKARMEAMRAKGNADTKHAYGLKGKK